MRIASAIVVASLAITTFSVAAEGAGWLEKQVRKGGRWVEKKGKKLESSGKKFLRNPIEYTVNLPAKIVTQVCSATPLAYEAVLRENARGSWNRLAPDFIAVVQPYYAINLRSVEYTLGSRTANGAAQTFGNRIYFPRLINLQNRDDVHWMLHELEHVVQYRGGTYGTPGKLCEYMMKSVGNNFDHDAIDMERAAENKANELIDGVMEALLDGGSQIMQVNEITVVNKNFGSLSFVIETELTDKEMYTINGNSYMIITGHDADRWFNIYLGDNDSVDVDAGTCNYLVWNGPVLQVQTGVPGRFGC